uniref:Uncharacterized protein n=1 Tax=Heterorhabditis bacteriophora TaxID=37862 RepID=A0A1I7X094_HETBA
MEANNIGFTLNFSERHIPPTKAPGDVSLSGTQLIAFLTKASLRLPQQLTVKITTMHGNFLIRWPRHFPKRWLPGHKAMYFKICII